MATFTSADIEAVLKEHVNPVLKEQFEQERMLYNLIGESGEPVNSRGTRIVSRVRPNASFAWFSEAGAFPAPGKEEYIEMKVFVTRCAMGFEFSGDFLNQIDTEENLVRGLSQVLSNYTDTSKKKLNQHMYGDGTGKLASVVSNDSTTQATFSTTSANGSLFGVRKLDAGGLYDFYSTAGVIRVAGNANGAQLNSKVESTGVGTFDGTLTVPTDVAATDIAVHRGSYNKAVIGLAAHVSNSTGAYQGISRATYPMLKAGVDDAGGAGITVGRLNKNKYAIRYRIPGTEAMNVTLISSPTQYDLFTRLGHNLIRFTDAPNQSTFKGDFAVAKHGNSDWLVDVDCPDDIIYGVDLNCFKRYVMKPFGAYREDGMDYRMFFSNGTGSDKYTGWLGAKFNLGCDKPNANFAITNLAVTDGAAGFSSLG